MNPHKVKYFYIVMVVMVKKLVFSHGVLLGPIEGIVNITIWHTIYNYQTEVSISMRFIGQIIIKNIPLLNSFNKTFHINSSRCYMSKLHVLLQKLFSIFLFGSIYFSLFYRYLNNGMVWTYASAHLNIRSNCVSFKPDRFCRIYIIFSYRFSINKFSRY